MGLGTRLRLGRAKSDSFPIPLYIISGSGCQSASYSYKTAPNIGTFDTGPDLDYCEPWATSLGGLRPPVQMRAGGGGGGEGGGLLAIVQIRSELATKPWQLA